MMNRIFEKEQQSTIEGLYADDLLFSIQHGTSLRLYNELPEVALHPTEVFYLSLWALDRIKSMPVEDAKKYVMNNLWDELIEQIRNQRETEDREVLQQNAITVMAVLYWAFVSSRNCQYTPYASLVFTQPVQKLTIASLNMLSEYDLSFHDVNNKAVDEYLSDYMNSTQKRAEALMKKLETSIRETEEQKPLPEDSGIRLAKGKLTAFIFVVEAMYKAHFFVDTDGNPLKSRDRVIKAFLQRVLGVEHPNIAQLRNAGTSRNKVQNPAKYLQDLMDAVEE